MIRTLTRLSWLAFALSSAVRAGLQLADDLRVHARSAADEALDDQLDNEGELPDLDDVARRALRKLGSQPTFDGPEVKQAMSRFAEGVKRIRDAAVKATEDVDAGRELRRGRKVAPSAPPATAESESLRCRCGKLKTDASDGCVWHEERSQHAARAAAAVTALKRAATRAAEQG
jgi:hypothetical protein